MYFYHEDIRDAYGIALDDWGSQHRRDDDQTDEPIQIPAILNWLVMVSVTLCVIVAAIQALS